MSEAATLVDKANTAGTAIYDGVMNVGDAAFKLVDKIGLGMQNAFLGFGGHLADGNATEAFDAVKDGVNNTVEATADAAKDLAPGQSQEM